MSFLRTFERASSCKTTYQVVSQSLFAFLCPALHDQVPPKVSSQHGRRARRRPTPALPPALDMDKCFITALVRAGSCSIPHTKQTRSHRIFTSNSSNPQRRRAPNGATAHQQRTFHTTPARQTREGPSTPIITADELHSLVDVYDTREEQPPAWQNSQWNDNVSVGPEALDTPWDDAYFTENQYLVPLEPLSEASHVLEAIKVLLDDPDTPHEELYTLYQKLPGNRVNHIPGDTLVRLLTHLSRLPAYRFKKEYADNFLSLLYDLRAENMAVSIMVWTTAIRFLGISEGARQAIRLWREMEQHYGLRANNFTFSVLFDQAVKSHHLALAEMIEKESRERNIHLDRISRMSRIFYYGILGDGQNVRRSYAQLVDAGEIVDTAVLTNVITALIDAGELPAAEETFERMKRLHAEKKGATQAPQSWRERRELRALLTNAGHQYRDRPEDRQRFQDAAPINPDWRTYRAFIRHHTHETGEWHRIEALLDEMRTVGISLNTEIFRALFGGFTRHGGIQLASWNKMNLERIWNEFERACEKDPYETSLDPKLALTIVKAFCFCAEKWRARTVWDAILDRWEPPRYTEMQVNRLLRRQEPWHAREEHIV